MTCQILFDKFLDVSAVLRACCASVHSFLVWVCLGKRLLGYPTNHPIEGPMRLDEIVLWERSYPFYLRGVLRDRSLLERTDYYGEQFPKVFLACEREYLSLSADERKTYDWSIQCHKFRTSTCARELPTLWDFLLTGPLPLPLPVLVAEPEPVPESNLTCHVSAGSRLVLLRTKQIATQSFIPEFSIFSVLSDSFFIAYWAL
ncbi:hypothetical protein PAPYR_11416 [Paratrimastix pyriformis]|uniref:Uncharacterized protein n=1 Tax=Paratrimastix pyriformis TaxID=342808 RepID=A0ABQ8U810_9EUKA|nr:hypothetical protein PAPYR_11416 [Paratrimastix pyriformis]